MNRGSPPNLVSLPCKFVQQSALAPNPTTITSIGTPEVTQLVANLSAIYSPELVVGFTPVCTMLVVHGPC
jgi:hypothetical protein